MWAAAVWRGCRLGEGGVECDESAASPIIINITPSFNATLHQAPDGSGCVREEGRRNSHVWRRVMRHTWCEWSLITAAVKRRGHLSSRDRSLSRAHMLVSLWVQEGNVEGFPCRQRCEPPDPQSRRNRGRRGKDAGLPVLSSAVGQEADEAAGKATAPFTPDLRGERVRPPDSAPYPDPCFQNTVPPSQTPQHDEDTRSPVYFGHFSPFGHFILLFLLNKK